MTKKLAASYYNLSVMLDAGIPMLKALDTIAESIKGNLQNAFSALAKGISAAFRVGESALQCFNQNVGSIRNTWQLRQVTFCSANDIHRRSRPDFVTT